MNKSKYFDLKEIKEFMNKVQTKNEILSIKNRIIVLKKIKKWIKANYDSIIDALYKDLNKSEIESLVFEISIVLKHLNFYIKNISDYFSAKKANDRNIDNLFSKAIVKKFPIGNVFLINPYNYPFHLVLTPLITSIAAGNYTIVKNSNKNTNSNQLVINMIKELELNNIVYLLNDSLTRDNIFDVIKLKPNMIFYNGNKEFGDEIKQLADKFNIKTVLHLGSCCPVIVEETANIKIASKRIVWGKLFNSGQTTIAPNSVYIESSVYNETLELLKNEMRIQYFNNVFYEFTKMINTDHVDKVIELVKKYTNVTINYNKNNLMIEPIVIEVEPNNPILNIEIFAPILFVTKFDNLNILLFNLKTNNNNPLAFYLFTENKKVIDKIFNNFSFGCLSVNEILVHSNNIHLPFGANGSESGNGRFYGYYGLREFSIIKPILYGSKISLNLRYFNKINLLKNLIKLKLK